MSGLRHARLTIATALGVSLFSASDLAWGQVPDLDALADTAIREIEKERQNPYYSASASFATSLYAVTEHPRCYPNANLASLRSAWPTLARYLVDNPGPAGNYIPMIIAVHSEAIGSRSDRCRFVSRVLSHSVRSSIAEIVDGREVRSELSKRCDYGSQELIDCVVGAIPKPVEGKSDLTEEQVNRARLLYRAEVTHALGRWDYDVARGLYGLIRLNSLMECEGRASLDLAAERNPILADLIATQKALDPSIDNPALDELGNLMVMSNQYMFGDDRGKCAVASREHSWAFKAHFVKLFGAIALGELNGGCGEDWLACLVHSAGNSSASRSDQLQAAPPMDCVFETDEEMSEKLEECCKVNTECD